ncbi:MAG: amidohydrolase family protein [Chloroflexota bacterium]
MALDLSEFRVIDDHCHPFDPKRETQGFEQYWTLAMCPLDPLDMKNTILYRLVLRELSKFLELGPRASEAEIIAKRNTIYKENPKTYLDILFRAAGIDTLMLDIGYPSEEFVGYSVDIDEFSSLLPISLARKIVRIEPIMFRLIKQELHFPEFAQAFNESLENEIKKHNAVALKTVIAYPTGLEVKRLDEAQVARHYYSYLVDKTDKLAEKGVRDFLVFQTLEACMRHDIPLQLHTGVGDSPIIDLRLSNPLHLFNILKDEHFSKAKIVIVHAGYPYTAEAGFLANTYPNVFIDLSEMNPFASIGLEPKLLELMEMTPLTKLFYGSDGYNIPELFWFSAIYFKKVLGRVLDKLIVDEVFEQDEAITVAKWILGENAKRVYRL